MTPREGKRSWARGHPGLALLAATSFAFALWTAPAYAGPGDLDRSFSGNGKLTIDFGTDGLEYALGVAQLPSERIVVVAASAVPTPVGPPAGAVLIARLKKDGSPDTSFSGDGTKVVDPPGDQGWTDASVQPDGSVVVVGGSPFPTASPSDFAVARIGPAGQLDPSLSGDGFAEIDVAPGENDVAEIDDFATAVIGQPDGRFVVGGFSGVARLEPDGSLDPTFSEDGRATPPLAVRDLTPLQGGGIVAVGGALDSTGGLNLAAARLLPDGVPDPSFGDDGTEELDFGQDEVGLSVTVQTDGRIVVGGGSSSRGSIGKGSLSSSLLLRLEPDGSLDQSFPVLTALPVGDVTDLVAQASGVLGVGPASQRFSNHADFVLFGRRTDGSPDRSFPRRDGSTRTDFHHGTDAALDLAEQADGKVMVTGDVETKIKNKRLLALARRLKRRAREASGERAKRLERRAKRIQRKAIESGQAVGVARYLMRRGAGDGN